MRRHLCGYVYGRCVAMFADMCVAVDMCVDMRVDMRIDMCVDFV